METVPLLASSPRTIGPAAPAATSKIRAARSRPRLRRFLLSMSPGNWAGLDAIIVALAVSAAQTLLTFVAHGYGWIANRWLVCAAFSGSLVLAGLVFGLYERKTLMSRGAIVLRSALSLALGVVLAFACVNVFFYAHASRWMGMSVVLTFLGVALPLRLFAHEVITTSRIRLLCVGAGSSIRRLVGVLGRMHRQQYEVVGHVRAPGTGVRVAAGGAGFKSDEDQRFEQACPYLGNLDELAGVLRDQHVDEVIVDPELASHAGVGQAVAVCLEGHCRVTDKTTFIEKLLGEVPVDSLNAEWFLKADVQNHGSYEAAKRLLDVLAAGVGVLLTLPLWPLIAVAIRLDSRGPAFYRQLRVGQHGRPFTIYKFRTMRTDAERNGAQWANENDTRVTRLGRFLRQSRLDELPQLWNILRGDMSLVGPRPERPEFVHNLEQLIPHYRLRHLIRPGLTGWAQIHFRYGASVQDSHRKLCYDLYYLKHRSIDMDFAILLRTFGTFVLGSR